MPSTPFETTIINTHSNGFTPKSASEKYFFVRNFNFRQFLFHRRNYSIFIYLQARLKSQEDLISSISCKIEELQTRDKKREIALEAANSILDKELTRVSSFVEEKVKYFFF